VPVGIEHESRITVLFARAGRTVVIASRGHRCSIELVYRGCVVGMESEMGVPTFPLVTQKSCLPP
jgi:hypothetical protein